MPFKEVVEITLLETVAVLSVMTVSVLLVPCIGELTVVEVTAVLLEAMVVIVVVIVCADVLMVVAGDDGIFEDNTLVGVDVGSIVVSMDTVMCTALIDICLLEGPILLLLLKLAGNINS